MINCAIYPRKSKADEKSESMEVQIAMCTEYLDKHYPNNYTVNIYDGDYGISGHSIKKRKDFQRMMEDIKAGKIQLVVIQRYDRIARNVRDFCNLFYEMEKNNCDLVSVSQQIDTTTPYGKNFMIQQAAMAELEWSLNSERRKDANRYAASIGKCVLSGASIPYGYTTQRIDGVRRLVIDKEKEPIVREVFKEYKKTRNMYTTMKHVNALFDTSTLDESRLLHMVHSPFYKGEYKGYKGYCEAYLTESEWDDLQKKKPQIRKKKHPKCEPLFTGLIKCPHCKRRMQVSLRYQNDKIYSNMHCRFHYAERCDYKKTKSERKIEKELIRYIDDNLDSVIEIKMKKESKKVPDADKKKKGLQKELERLNTMYQKGRISEEKYDSEYLRVEEELKELERLAKPQDNLKQLQESFSSDWKKIYNQLTPLNKRVFWSQVIEEIIVDESFTLVDVVFCV